KIVIQNCVVRGEGDLVTLRSSRPLELEIRESLIYLQGSVLDQQQGAAKEPATGDAISLQIVQSALMSVDAMFRLQAGKGPTSKSCPIRVESTDSLYARLSDQPIVQLDLPEVTEKMVPDLVKWTSQPGDRGDAFVNFGQTDPLLSASPAENGIAPQ